MSTMKIEARVQGIPCIVNVISYTPGRDGFTTGRPEDCYPDEGSESDWELQDRRGYRAKWLEKKMTDSDREKVEELIDREYLDQCDDGGYID